MSRNTLSKLMGYTLVVSVCGNTGASVAASRDWTNDPAVVQLDTSEDIFAIGDPHGDRERLADVLAAARLIDRAPIAPVELKWAGGRSILVVTGDLIDKGSDSIGVITLLRTLQADAARQGGRVIVTMGNHEAEFLAKPLGKKTKEFSSELGDSGLNPEDVANCGGDIGRFLCALPIAARVNDWFFSHGGNTNNRSIPELSAAIEAGFARDGFATEELVGDNSILEARLNKKGPRGLPWFQDGSASTNPKKLLTRYAVKLGVKHLVQGHQYNKVRFPDGKNRKEQNFYQRYGLLFLIDTGMSRGIDEDNESIGGALRITGAGSKQKAIVICADSKQKTLWSNKKAEREEQLCSE